MSALRLVALGSLLAVTLIVPGVGPLAAGGVWVLCLLLVASARPNGVLSLAALYLVLLGAFHLGVAVPVALGVARGRPPGWMSSPHLATALGLFSTAVVAFTMGALLRGTPAPAEDEPGTRSQPELFRVGLAVAVAGAAMLWLGVWQLGILAAGYGAYFENAMGSDVRFFGFGLMLFPLGLVVAAVGATERQMLALGAVFGLVLGPLFLVGFRGPTIVQGSALIAVWMHKDRRLARRLAAAGVLIAVVLVPAIRVSRDLALAAPGEISEVDPLGLLMETGGSLNPLIVTIERMEGGDELWRGRSYAMALDRILPNVSLRWKAPGAPAVGSTLTPSAWATLHHDPWALDHGGGIGFSGVAEPYLNFGTPGVVAFFFLLGLVIQVWERWLAAGRFRAAAGAASFGFVLWTVRNEATELFRAAAFASVIVLAAWLLARRRLLRTPEQPELQPGGWRRWGP